MIRQINKYLIIMFICRASVLPLQSMEFRVSSPSKHLQMMIHIDADIKYSVSYKGMEFIQDGDDVKMNSSCYLRLSYHGRRTL